MGDLPVLGVATVDDAIRHDARRTLEEALPAFLVRQRWFGSKTRPITRVSVADTGPVRPRLVPFLLIADVFFGDGGAERYAVPLTSLEAPRARTLLADRPSAALAWLDAEGGRLLADAVADDDACRGLFAAIQDAAESPLNRGRVRAERDSDSLLRVPLDETPVRRTGAEQSNSSMLFGAAAILKVYRRQEPGPHPELELGRFLNREGFAAVPAVLGSMEYAGDTGDCALAVLHALVPDATDGWEHALGQAAQYFARVGGRPAAGALELTPAGTLLEIAGQPLERARSVVGDYLDAAETLGRQTAALHLTLSHGSGDALRPEPLTAHDVAGVVEGTRARASRALALLASQRSRSGHAAERAVALIGRQPALFERLDALAAAPIQALRTRVHQDYHLGQLLWTGTRYVLLDFEGEPARPLGERRAKRSPLVDVAGMLRSYSYAAWSALFRWSEQAGADSQQNEPWAALWESAAVSSFLAAYLADTRGAPFLPRDPAHLSALLDLFVLDKGLYELEYELNNRPDWLLVPIEGLLKILTIDDSRG
jgi:maltose alpha-D-glucosyltransferase / alpha-amylase